MLLLTEYQNKLGYTVTPNGSWRLTQSPTNPVSLIVDGITSSYAVNQIIGTNDPDVIFPSGTYKLDYEISGSCPMASEITIDNYGRVLSIDTDTTNVTYTETINSQSYTPLTYNEYVATSDNQGHYTKFDSINYVYSNTISDGNITNPLNHSGVMDLSRYTVYTWNTSGINPARYIKSLNVIDGLGNSYVLTLNNPSNTLPFTTQAQGDILAQNASIGSVLLGLSTLNTSAGLTGGDLNIYNRIAYHAIHNVMPSNIGSVLPLMAVTVDSNGSVVFACPKLSTYYASGAPTLGLVYPDTNYLRLPYSAFTLTLDDNTVITPVLSPWDNGSLGLTQIVDFGKCQATVTKLIERNNVNPMTNAVSCNFGSITTFSPTGCNYTVLTATLTNQTNPTYQWHLDINCNSPIANETNQTYTASIGGPYSVKVTDGTCEYCESIYI